MIMTHRSPVSLSEREEMVPATSSDEPKPQLTRIDIVLSSPKIDKNTAYEEATAAANAMFKLGLVAGSTIDVFFTLRGQTYDVKIERK